MDACDNNVPRRSDIPQEAHMPDFDPAHVNRGGPPHRYADGPLEVTKLHVGPYENNAYLLRDPETNDALLVDAANEPERLLELLEGMTLAGIVTPDRVLEHGDTLTVGRYAITVLHTPGHTEGSISFKLPSSQVLTGDALFPGGVGKTEGPEAFTEAIRSAERHLLSLPGETRISPGHGDDGLVEREAPQLDEWKARGW